MKRFILILCLIASPLWAVQPDEILDDPALEARARDISAGLRCPVCLNESIDESNAPISKELRILVRELLVDGKSDDAVVAFIVARYGEFVLLSPPATGVNLILWLAAPGMLIAALGIGWATLRRKMPADDTLTPEEQARVQEILRS